MKISAYITSAVLLIGVGAELAHHQWPEAAIACSGAMAWLLLAVSSK